MKEEPQNKTWFTLSTQVVFFFKKTPTGMGPQRTPLFRKGVSCHVHVERPSQGLKPAVEGLIAQIGLGCPSTISAAKIVQASGGDVRVALELETGSVCRPWRGLYFVKWTRALK